MIFSNFSNADIVNGECGLRAFALKGKSDLTAICLPISRNGDRYVQWFFKVKEQARKFLLAGIRK